MFGLTSENWRNDHSILPGSWNIKTSQIKLYQTEKHPVVSMKPVEEERVLKVCLVLFLNIKKIA